MTWWRDLWVCWYCGRWNYDKFKDCQFCNERRLGLEIKEQVGDHFIAELIPVE